jgi:hypothetical protein
MNQGQEAGAELRIVIRSERGEGGNVQEREARQEGG